MAAAFGGAAWWLLWPSASLALVALAYVGAGPAVFQKRPDGTLAAAASWLLGPYLLGAWLNSRAWTRGLACADVVAPGLLVGRIPTGAELRRLPVAAVVDVSAELPCAARGYRYANVPMLDLVTPTVAEIQRATDAIALARQSGPVLVCCALGFSRSALAAGAWLLRAGEAAAAAEALERVRQARPAVVIGLSQRHALEAWWTTARRGA